AICTWESFHIKCDLSACAGNLLIFLFAAPPIDCFSNKLAPALKQCFQSNRSARQNCENLPKVCRNKRTNLHFDFGR
ncbi:MAG: hypothetical protein SO267_12470, partial [Lachnospiraceae bacterium]|nr:hypothetical protein [Lachnospiraceae bacterium]